MVLMFLAHGIAAEAVPPVVTKYYFPATPADAKVVTATFLGGKGHEWLVGGGWQPDGAVILAGNVIGPLPGETGDVPPLDVPTSGSGRVVALWNTNGVTGFLAQCEPDLKRLVAVHRLPWPGAVVTGALVERGGAVYVAGLTGTNGFVGKIAADLKRPEWQIALPGPTPPQLRLLGEGTLWVRAQDVQVLDDTGKVLRKNTLPDKLSQSAAVNPRDGRIAKNTNHGNWSTGREPWKCPGVRILNPDGADLYYLYEWDGRYIGLDNHRSVADTSVGALNYDDDGNLFLYTWSDGGNTVMRYRSTDVRRPHGCKGLPFYWGGTGYNIVKLDGRDYQTIASTQWAAESGHGRGIMRMNTLLPLPNGTVCVAGIGGSRGVHETTTSLMPTGPTGGNYVTLLAGDLASARFSTMVGGAGAVNVGRGAWGAVAGVVNGQQKVLLLTGAKAMNDTSALAPTAERTPVANAMQAAFGGGTLDGYAILLDLPAAPPSTNAPTVFPRLNLASVRAVKKSTNEFAEAGAKFYFSSNFPSHVTAEVEIRDAKDKRWPNFAYGRSVEGELAWRDGKLAGRATVQCAHWLQQIGDQSRRVLGGIAGPLPPFIFTISELGELKQRDVDRKSCIQYFEGQGRVGFGGRTVTAPVQCVPRMQPKPPDNAVPALALDVFFTVKGKDLGLTDLAADEIDVRVGMRGTFTPGAPPAPAKRK
jgi:hypothetical protein